MKLAIIALIGLLILWFITYIIINIFLYLSPRNARIIREREFNSTYTKGDILYKFRTENSYKVEQIKKENLDENIDFINQNCTSLEDFIINDEINVFDLIKLADLNQIPLQISAGWYPLVIDLLKELNENDWNKRVLCIRVKNSHLRFDTENEHKSKIHTIILKYSKKSEYTCDTCGEKGEWRVNDSDHISCRKHYVENRVKITTDDFGFNHNGNYHLWKEIKDVLLENLDNYDCYRKLTIEFKNNFFNQLSQSENKLIIWSDSIGFGNLLNNLPKKFQSINLIYFTKFENPEFCEICGYKAVYFGECECCENYTWEMSQNRYKMEDYEKDSHISECQLAWTAEDGEIYESQVKNYIKNPNYKILFTEDELKKYLEEEN